LKVRFIPIQQRHVGEHLCFLGRRLSLNLNASFHPLPRLLAVAQPVVRVSNVPDRLIVVWILSQHFFVSFDGFLELAGFVQVVAFLEQLIDLSLRRELSVRERLLCGG